MYVDARCLIIAFAVLLGSARGVPAYAQEPQGSQYFPETGHTVSGRLLDFWQHNGGRTVFGYPLTEPLEEAGRRVQYFERQRLEWYPEHAPPYDVVLGRVGAERLEARGVDWSAGASPADANPTCLYVEQTRHNICDQDAATGFRSYWTSHGLELDGQVGTSFQESVALFGYPLTEAYVETTSSGDVVVTQWFDRARLEWHGAAASADRVLLGRLGAEALDDQQRQSEAPTFSQVEVVYIAIGDNGRLGTPVGCGDSAVPITVSIAATPAPLAAALERLLAAESSYYDETSLYTALYGSRLHLDTAIVEHGQATIYLSGQLQLDGVCDLPRVDAQIKETARHVTAVDQVEVYLNGQQLEAVMSGN